MFERGTKSDDEILDYVIDFYCSSISKYRMLKGTETIYGVEITDKFISRLEDRLRELLEKKNVISRQMRGKN